MACIFPGVDIVAVERFTRAYERRPKLGERLFTLRERENLQDKGLASWAAHFAGKEAILKTLGTGLKGLSWHDIEILNNSLGEPEVILSEKAQRLVRSRGGKEIRVTLSHEKEYAIAMAILY